MVEDEGRRPPKCCKLSPPSREPEASSRAAASASDPTKKSEKEKKWDASGGLSRSDKKNRGASDARRWLTDLTQRRVPTVLTIPRQGPRNPKRQCTLLLSFYAEYADDGGVLFDALVKVGAVSEDNADDLVKDSRSTSPGQREPTLVSTPQGLSSA
ncbi:hypothetical protein BDN71DRAFT_1429772 [Pleurotus eryngii]|uniref:Uncharacterized protein n=1 Tax=Pleurotus eryngii TaxID=5323 RepID=A0A9P6DGV9_PLEER|nr:hypothetical protein BDN71DRAFT_1429772 [Pleurotus eryngii]